MVWLWFDRPNITGCINKINLDRDFIALGKLTFLFTVLRGQFKKILMNNPIFIIVEGEVASEKFDGFKEIISRMVNHVRETEPTTLSYSYFENGTGTEFRIIEQYTSVEAVLSHNENIAAYMEELNGMVTFRKITGFGDVDLSTLPDSSREILDGICYELWTPFAAR